MATMPTFQVHITIDAGDPATSALVRQYIDACKETNALAPSTSRVALRGARIAERAAGRALFAALMQAKPAEVP